MNEAVPLVDFAPTLRLALLAAVAALPPLCWVWLRQRGGSAHARLAALTAVTLFLTFDLIVFGAFTRLTDSGLGCPDWPGCYGEASPIGAREDIHAAQTAMPGGPVTFTKAWIEMIHRYLAMTVGVLILTMTLASLWPRAPQRPGPPALAPGRGPAGEGAEAAVSAWWPAATLLWVIVQGLFGKYTVTLKLYPAVVTAHLLGGMLLLALLVVQHERWRGRALALPARLKLASWAVTLLLWVQIALGGWVSTNYAVLACSGFPQCNGQWWPSMDFSAGFTVLRELGRSVSGAFIPMEALVAVHMVHRLVAYALLLALCGLAMALWRTGEPAPRRISVGLLLLALWQLASGLSNVVLGWPIAAALAHSAGAAALVALSTSLLARSAAPARRSFAPLEAPPPAMTAPHGHAAGAAPR